MIPHFKIEKEKLGRYIIKRRAWLIPPLYDMRIMTKNEFFGDLTEYGDNVLSLEVATFASIEQTYEALKQYSKINGISEVVLKICND